jgi:hypothetical protein
MYHIEPMGMELFANRLGPLNTAPPLTIRAAISTTWR